MADDPPARDESPSYAVHEPQPMQAPSLHDMAAMGMQVPRRQNVACDQCRGRKVKCLQVPGANKCQHCISKNIACTYEIQKKTAQRKQEKNPERRPRGGSSSESRVVKSSSFDGVFPVTRIQPSATTSESPVVQLIQYLLSPDGTSPRGVHSLDAYAPIEDWGDYGKRLIDDEAYRIEFTWDLVEAYFQICHARLPFLNPDDFRAALRSALDGALPVSRQLHPALLATVLAWGAKFAEHNVLSRDRQANNGRSLIARTLVRKAQRIAERERVHRIATPDNIIVALLLEPLQSQNVNDPDGSLGFWLNCAIRHLMSVHINSRENVLAIQDADLRSTMVFCWWMACFADAYSAVYFRRKPLLDDDDYNIDFWHFDIPTSPPLKPGHLHSAPGQEFAHWYAAAHGMTRCARQMSRALWTQRSDAEGIPAKQLSAIVRSLDDWRDEHLARVGMHNFAQHEWGFLEAVSMCASDATYHTMWIILFNAVEECSIRELRQAGIHVTMNSDAPLVAGAETVQLDAATISQVEDTRVKLQTEAGLAALRIAELISVLTQQNYLRLDPNVMHFSAYAAGLHLARLGRPEAITCIMGLRQYGVAYEDALDQANELERIFRMHTGTADFDVFHHPQNGYAHAISDRTVIAGAEVLMGLGEHPVTSEYALYPTVTVQSPAILEVGPPQHTPPQNNSSFPLIYSPH